ncbi:MAG: hypothetical protein ACW98F_11250 [Candidatus Hodarchaeales archaeon]
MSHSGSRQVLGLDWIFYLGKIIGVQPQRANRIILLLTLLKLLQQCDYCLL